MTKKFLKSYDFMLLCVVVSLVVILAIATGGKSIAPENIIDILTSYSAYGIMAVGCLFVIISGGIDISFMIVGAIAQFITAKLMLSAGTNFPVVYIVSILIGAALGLINGILVNRLKVPALIITIATMNILYGITMRLTKGVRLHGFPEWFANKSPVTLFGVSVGTLIVVMVLAWYILNRTKMGRKIFAVGGNLEAARRAGINILSVHLFVYAFTGATAGVGALVKMYLSQQASIEALYGNEMDVLAMVVLGGVALSGGKGSVFGTFLGILLIAVLSNGMILVGVSSYWKNLVIGAVILISFCITGWRLISAAKKERLGGGGEAE